MEQWERARRTAKRRHCCKLSDDLHRRHCRSSDRHHRLEARCAASMRATCSHAARQRQLAGFRQRTAPARPSNTLLAGNRGRPQDKEDHLGISGTAREFFSPRISNAQRLPNGNTLICEGDSGRLFEVTAGGELVWEYVNPYFGGAPTNNRVFRAYRYSAEEIARARATGPAP